MTTATESILVAILLLILYNCYSSSSMEGFAASFCPTENNVNNPNTLTALDYPAFSLACRQPHKQISVEGYAFQNIPPITFDAHKSPFLLGRDNQKIMDRGVQEPFGLPGRQRRYDYLPGSVQSRELASIYN